MEKTNDVFKRLDDWWIRGSFPTFEWSIYFAVAQIEKDIMWLVEMEPDEDGMYPRKVYTAWRYIDNSLEVGDLIYINFYDKPPKFTIEKKSIEVQALQDWMDEQVGDKIKNLDAVLFKKRKDQTTGDT